MDVMVLVLTVSYWQFVTKQRTIFRVTNCCLLSLNRHLCKLCVCFPHVHPNGRSGCLPGQQRECWSIFGMRCDELMRCSPDPPGEPGYHVLWLKGYASNSNLETWETLSLVLYNSFGRPRKFIWLFVVVGLSQQLLSAYNSQSQAVLCFTMDYISTR